MFDTLPLCEDKVRFHRSWIKELSFDLKVEIWIEVIEVISWSSWQKEITEANSFFKGPGAFGVPHTLYSSLFSKV